MAKTVSVNGVTYSDVPQVNLPLAAGGGDGSFFETSDATGSANHVLQGYTVYGANGKVIGTFTAANVVQDPVTKILTIS